MDRWEELFRPPNLDSIASPRNAIHTGKIVLVTGAGGSIGSALARAIATANPRFLILLDHSEENLYQVEMKLERRAGNVPRAAILGDISDGELLREMFEERCPEIIYHAAAYKHVPLMEENPLAVFRNNVMGTQVLAETAAEYEVPRFLMISTDKAVNPRSVMGVSKRIAELLLLRLSSPKTQPSAVRFGNVFGSNGSVVPRFLEQIESGGPVTVTDAEASRYFITLPEAVEIILEAVSQPGSGIFVPKLGAQAKILDLAKRMIADAQRATGKQIQLQFVGLRPGEKMSEELVSESESVTATDDLEMYRVSGPRIENTKLDSAIGKLTEGVKERKLSEVMEIVSELVPEYLPSESVSANANRLTVRVRT